MRDDGLCQPCRRNQIATAASEVDHIIAKGLGGTDDTDNLQSICKPCHKRKTKEDVRAIRAHGGKFQEGG
jgi:5-methylcytosine-specific restriction protein A